jgi:heat-inducible transcriptional repressor
MDDKDVGAAPLSPRQEEILARVIESYVATRSPVGSKTLVERGGVEASPSTVRNELAVLEEHGFLTHPHTSAGRVPTDAGYRIYVDHVLGHLESRPTPGFQLDLTEAQSHVDEALQATTDALAQLTHLLALVSAPAPETTSVRHVEVILLQPQLVMVVVITSTGGVSKRVFAFTDPVDPGLAEWAREYLNDQVAGLQLGARTLRARFDDPDLARREREFLTALAPAFTELADAGEQSLYVGGAAGLLDEFRQEDLPGYRRLLEVLERRAELLGHMRASLVSKEPFVRVGSDFGDPDLQSIALVAAPYGLRHRNLGTVSLLGPMRMDYVRSIEVVRSAAHELSLFVEEIYEE